MTHDEQFFYYRAGFSWDPKTQTEEEGRMETARKLAKSESFASTLGWSHTWEPDNDADPFDWDGDGPMGTEASAYILRDTNGHVLTSLGGIWDADANYARVVMAELSLEAMTDVLQSDTNGRALDHLIIPS